MPPVLKIHTVTSTGERAAAHTRKVTLLHPRFFTPLLNEDRTPAVWALLKPAHPDEWKAIRERHTAPRRNPVTKIVEWYEDLEAATNALLSEHVQAWEGFVGSDDEPLRLCPASVEALPNDVKAQLMRQTLDAEVVEIAAASFRESAGVAGVVGGLAPHDGVLSDRQ